MQNEGSLGQLAWRKFRKNPLGILPLGFIALSLLVALFAYLLVPDRVQDANQVRLPLALHPPGTEVSMLSIPLQRGEESGNWLTGYTSTHREIPILSYSIEEYELRVVPYTGMGSLGGLETRYSKADLSLETHEKFDERIAHRRFFLGTDKLGRDYLSRLLLGARISLTVGFIAVGISLLVGLLLGSLAGYFGGKVDAGIMWFINVFWSVPTLLWVIAISLALGKGLWQVYVAVGLSMWVDVARMVRGQIMQVRSLEFSQAGKAMGYGNARILFRHVLPNSLSPVIVIAASNFATAILLEAGLSFLGIGAQPPIPSWGNMIKDHYAYIIMDKAYLALLPGLAIMVLVLAFMLIGNAVRDALDVKI